MYTLQMQTSCSDRWYTVGIFDNTEKANDYARFLRTVLRGVTFQLVM